MVLFNHTDFAFNFISLIQTIFFKPQLQNKDIQEKIQHASSRPLLLLHFMMSMNPLKKKQNKKKNYGQLSFSWMFASYCAK